LDLRNTSEGLFAIFFVPEEMVGGWRVRVAMAFVGFRCVGEEFGVRFRRCRGFVEEDDWFERAGSEFEQAVLSRVLCGPPVRRKVPRFRRIGGHGPFG